MRRRANLRVVITGAVLIALAATFFVGMLATLAPKSNDPAAMMQTVGEVAGVLVGLGAVMMVVGLIGKGH
jgi:CHASE2 domain-containing sensor protein